MSSEYIEVEHKWKADHVDWSAFIAYFTKKKKQIVDEQVVLGPDQYWRADFDTQDISKKINELLFGSANVDVKNVEKVSDLLQSLGVGQSVARYRSNKNGFHELTVKRRISKSSTTVRGETDLLLRRDTKNPTVGSFLSMLGYKHEFTIVKRCHIFTIKNHIGIAIPVIYDIWLEGQEDDVKRFIEVEGDKSQSQEQNEKVIAYWKEILEDRFELTNKHLSKLSLYEIFSKNKYWISKE